MVSCYVGCLVVSVVSPGRWALLLAALSYVFQGESLLESSFVPVELLRDNRELLSIELPNCRKRDVVWLFKFLSQKIPEKHEESADKSSFVCKEGQVVSGVISEG